MTLRSRFLLSLAGLVFLALGALAQPCPRIERVNLEDNTATIVNLGDDNVTGLWWFCARLLYSSPVLLSIAPGLSQTVPVGLDLNDISSDFALYHTNNFPSASAMEDFVQWGASGLGREGLADDRGFWVAGEFVPTPLGAQLFWNGTNCNDRGLGLWDHTIPVEKMSWAAAKSRF